MAKSFATPKIPGTANSEWLLPEITGSANAEWRELAARQFSLALPILSGKSSPDAKKRWHCQSRVASEPIGGLCASLFPQVGSSCSAILMKKSH
jgi:hypothetical protein